MPLAPGWMIAVCFSTPCPPTSKACGILPAFVIANLTVPGAIVPWDSSTFHSVSRTLTRAGASGNSAAPSSAPARSTPEAARATSLDS